MKLISIYTTFSSKDEAQKIIQALLQKRLIACANIFDIESHFIWKQTPSKESEIGAFLKTQDLHWKQIQEIITQKHTYEVPCVTKTNIESNEYLKWVIEQTS